jgi:hypothetical protein
LDTFLALLAAAIQYFIDSRFVIGLAFTGLVSAIYFAKCLARNKKPSDIFLIAANSAAVVTGFYYFLTAISFCHTPPSQCNMGKDFFAYAGLAGICTMVLAAYKVFEIFKAVTESNPA